MPAVAGLGHQQGDDVSLGEAQQRAVVACGVGEDGLDAGTPVLLQTCSHGTGPGQGPRLSWPVHRHTYLSLRPPPEGKTDLRHERSLRLTHGVLVLGGGGPADREGVGVDIADLLLGMSLSLALGLRGRGPHLGQRPSIRPILFPVDSGCPVDHGHTIGADQPLGQTSIYVG